MANGMGSLYIGHSGLISSRDSINNVANNLANVNTAGYVRQQVVFRDTHYNNIAYSKDGNKKLTGLGTSVGEIVHARDIFLDKAYRRENGRQSYYAASFEAIDEVQNYFQELEGTAFQQIIDGYSEHDNHDGSLWQAFEEFSKDPSDMANQNLVVQKASLFVSRAQAVYKGLMKYQSEINTQISEDIDKINDYIKQIYELNVRIQTIESGGRETAMNERDARDYAIDQLSKYGNIQYEEGKGGTVSVKFENILVADEMFHYEIGKKTDRMSGFITPYWPHLSNEEGGRYTYVFDFSQKICTEFDTDIGELKALIQARGIASSNFNDINNANPDHYDATVGLSIMQNTEAEFDNLVHQIVKQINDIFVPNKDMESLWVQNADGTYSHFKNVKVLDEENCCVGEDGKMPPQELFTRSGCERYQKVRAYDSEKGEWRDYYLYNEEDINDSKEVYYSNGGYYNVFDPTKGSTVTTYESYDPETGETGTRISGMDEPYMPWNKSGNSKYILNRMGGKDVYVLNEDYKYDTSKQYTAMEININHNLLKQVKNIPHINQQMEIDQSMAFKLTQIWQNQSVAISPRYPDSKYTFGEYYKEMIGEIAIIGSGYGSTAENLEGTVASIENQRDGVIGVSSDEELTRMIKYQNAYNASSRYIQTVSDMIELLVSGL